MMSADDVALDGNANVSAIVAVHPQANVSVVVRNPHNRTRVLVRHDGLSHHDANEIVVIYRALGYTGFIDLVPEIDEADTARATVVH